MRILGIVLIFLSLSSPALAGRMTSEYTKLETENNCLFKKTNESDGFGISGKCSGLKGYPVHFSEGDLRQMVEFGFMDTQERQWISFSEWNYAGKVIEWRLEAGRPVATIQRWFIENIDTNTGSAVAKLRGQVLVISKVGQPSVFDACVVGFVDARSNSNANVLARDVADNIAVDFQCNKYRPKFYGIRGPYSGSPTGLYN